MKPEDLKAYMYQVSKDRGLALDVVQDAVEQALLQAMKRGFAQYMNPRIAVSTETGEISLWVIKQVVPRIPMNVAVEISLREAVKLHADIQVGDEMEVQVKDVKIAGRIVAQQAHQFILVRLKEAERNKIYADFAKRIGELVDATVDRHERDYVVLRLPDNTEASLPRKQMIGNPRHLKPKESIKVLIWKVEPENTRGPIVITTRTSKEFILRLFEREVPEIADGTVEIVAIARDAGLRTKIAVRSSKNDIDPVGACVGQKGSRVQQVVRELETEKVDVIAWSDDPVILITDAINSGSAEKIVVGVRIVRYPEDKYPGRAVVTVKRDNVAVALGRKGVNVDLSNTISGYRIEVVREGEEQKRDVADVARDYLNDFLQQMGLDENVITLVNNSAFNSVESLTKASPAGLLHLVNGDRVLATNIIAGSKEYFEEMRKLTRHTANGGEVAGAGEQSEQTEQTAPSTDGPSTDEPSTDEEPGE